MYLSRIGAKRDHGPRYVILPAPIIRWADNESSVKMQFGEAKGFYDGPSSHNYSVNLELGEALQIIMVLANAAMSNPEFFEQKLLPVLAPLTQLQAVAAGLVRS